MKAKLIGIMECAVVWAWIISATYIILETR